MEDKVQIFDNPEFGKVRVVMIDGEPWLVGKDVATALGYKDPGKAIREHVPDKFKGGAEMDTPGGVQNVVVINEAGMYKLVMRSKLESAENFSDWVCEEVLPSIRKTGSYSVECETNAVELKRIDADLKIATMSLEQKKIDERIENARQLKGIAALTHDSDFREYLLREAAKYITGEEFVPEQDYENIPAN